MKRRPRLGTRRRRLQRNMRSPMRRNRRLRNRACRQARAEMIGGLIEMFEKDDRLVPPPWVRDYQAASLILNPKDLIRVTGS